jgi:hypothetical protein
MRIKEEIVPCWLLAAGRKAKRDNRTSNVNLDFVGSSSTYLKNKKKKKVEKGEETKLVNV